MDTTAKAPEYRWEEIEEDHPVPLLHRKRIQGERILIAKIRLEKGCVVALHSHPNEQIAMIFSGHVSWTIGEGAAQYQREMRGGEVLHLPSGLPHGIEALEDTEIIDLLSPPGPMGVDAPRG